MALPGFPLHWEAVERSQRLTLTTGFHTSFLHAQRGAIWLSRPGHLYNTPVWYMSTKTSVKRYTNEGQTPGNLQRKAEAPIPH